MQKNKFVHLIFFLIFSIYNMQSQTWHIEDAAVAAEKTVLAGMLIGEISQLNKIENRYERLTDIEIELNKKRKLKYDFNATYITSNTFLFISSLKIKCATLPITINLHLHLNTKIKYGLRKMINEITSIKADLLDIENDFYLASYPLSGGTGYNMNANLKLLKKLIVHDEAINQIRYKLNNLIAIKSHFTK
jgi:hypothetical protein